MKLLNENYVPLSMALWLATDEYDHNYDPKHISCTGLLKPLRQIVLSRRIEESDDIDISSFVPSRMGSAIHDAVGRIWLTKELRDKALKLLGHSEDMIKRIKVNPKKSELTPDTIPVYIEQRYSREVSGYNVSGQSDFIGDGLLEDFKSTGTYTWIKDTSTELHQLQGSIYRYLAPEIITKDFMYIRFVFTDWSKLQAIIGKKKNYPQHRLMSKKIPLLSLEETEKYIKDRIQLIVSNLNVPEKELPQCTPEELWRGDSVFKYYKNPDKTTRSTKNFVTYEEAEARRLKDNCVGIVKEVKGKVKRCNYCSALDICTQKDEYLNNGTLELL